MSKFIYSFFVLSILVSSLWMHWRIISASKGVDLGGKKIGMIDT